MKKLLKISDWFLLGIAGFLDFIDEVRDPFGLISSYYENFYGYVPLRYRRQRCYQFVWRSLKTGDIRKKVVKGKVYLEITSAGKERIKRLFPILFFKNQKWDGIFRLVIYDIEEKEKRVRELFRKKLKELGFGMVQRSVWVSCYDFLKDFKEFLESYRLEKKVILIETENFYVGDLKTFAEKVWQIRKINNEYQEIYDELSRYQSLKKKSDRYQLLNKLRLKIISLYFKDPFLPKEFLPEEWMGDKVINLVKKLRIFS